MNGTVYPYALAEKVPYGDLFERAPVSSRAVVL